jgi:hypothetical protein
MYGEVRFFGGQPYIAWRARALYYIGIGVDVRSVRLLRGFGRCRCYICTHRTNRTSR